ncbi:MAG: hypothetical protein ACRD68_09635 [Pyrinomonadaceae bacterium]
MKNFVNRVVVALAVCALTSIVALADGKSGQVTFLADTAVNGQVVKKGTYKVKFDDKTGELAIFVNKSNVIKTAARLEKRDRKARYTEVNNITKGSDKVLRSITFRGEDEAIVLSDAAGGTTTAGQQQ